MAPAGVWAPPVRLLWPGARPGRAETRQRRPTGPPLARRGEPAAEELRAAGEHPAAGLLRLCLPWVLGHCLAACLAWALPPGLSPEALLNLLLAIGRPRGLAGRACRQGAGTASPQLKSNRLCRFGGRRRAAAAARRPQLEAFPPPHSSRRMPAAEKGPRTHRSPSAVPGGHGPMIDLANDDRLGRVLTEANAAGEEGRGAAVAQPLRPPTGLINGARLRHPAASGCLQR